MFFVCFLLKRVACSKNDLELVKYLVEVGRANVEEIDAQGETCLFYAGKKNKLKIYIIF